MPDLSRARWDALADLLDVEAEDVEAEVHNIRAKIADVTYRLVTVLTWHNPVEAEYRDVDGNVTRTITECAHCSTLPGDGVDWPCATAHALGALDSGVAEAEKRGAVKLLDYLMRQHADSMAIIQLDLAGLWDRLVTGEVTLP